MPAPTRTSACCCGRRWTRSPSCRSACWSTNGAGACSTARSTPANYNKAWVDLKLRYQGITPPVERSEADFDPGAKFHIPGNTPYARYFLARMLQFQFYKAACDMSGWKGPLHRCSFYGNKEVGAAAERRCWRWARRKPWPDALEAFTGSREMSAQPMLEYFAPLQAWLEEQNKGSSAAGSIGELLPSPGGALLLKVPLGARFARSPSRVKRSLRRLPSGSSEPTVSGRFGDERRTWWFPVGPRPLVGQKSSRHVLI